MFSQISPTSGHIRIMRTEPTAFLCVCLRYNCYTFSDLSFSLGSSPNPQGVVYVFGAVSFVAFFFLPFFSFFAVDVGFAGF